MTCGPWRTIVLEQYSAKLKDLWCRATINKEAASASIKVVIEPEGCITGDIVRLRVLDPSGQTTLETIDISADTGHVEATVQISNAKYWWPIGYGEQPLYKLTAELLRDVSKHT
jgi:beta-mannosidase